MDAHREAVVAWFVAASGVIVQLLSDAERLRSAAKTPGHPLAKILDPFLLKELAQELGQTSCEFTNAAPLAKCPVALPSPFPA